MTIEEFQTHCETKHIFHCKNLWCTLTFISTKMRDIHELVCKDVFILTSIANTNKKCFKINSRFKIKIPKILLYSEKKKQKKDIYDVSIHTVGCCTKNKK